MVDLAQRTQVVITVGPENPGRAELGLQSALAAACSGVAVTVFFTLRGARWVCATPPDRHQGLLDLVARLRDFGAGIECCSKCVDKVCDDLVEVEAHGGLLPACEASGLTSMMQRVAQGVPTVVF